MEPVSSERAALTIEEISSATLAISSDRDLAGMATRFFAIVQSWAAPSLIACIEADPRAEEGWRLNPALTSGQVPPGIERSLAKLVGDARDGALTRPTLIRPTDDLPGGVVKVRDSWIVPWRRGETSGFLLLRGVSRPYPPNIGDAVALVSQPLWGLVSERKAVDPERPVAERLRALEEVSEAAHRLVGQLAAQVKGEQERREAEQSPSAPVPASGESEALEAARKEIAELQEKTEALEDSRSAAEADRDRASAEAEAALRRAEAAEQDAEALRTRAAENRRELDEARGLVERERAMAAVLAEAIDEAKAAHQASDAVAKKNAALLAERLAELDEARRERDEGRRRESALQIRVDGLEKGINDAHQKRDQAKATANELWGNIESLQRQVQATKERFASQGASLDQDRKALEQEVAELKAAAERAHAGSLAAEASAAERVREAEQRAREAEERAGRAEDRIREGEGIVREAGERAGRLSERWAKIQATLREAIEALRRTPFVPPTLRVSFSDAEALLDEGDGGAKRTPASAQILLLDRDVPGLDSLARALEAGGLDVLIAHYPEEVGFFLKTAAARRVTALVCDVMAFRQNQDLLETLSAWRRDLPNLPVLLSFKSDTPLEVERAHRVPVVLTAGYVPRPMELRVLVDALAASGKRQAGAVPRPGGA